MEVWKDVKDYEGLYQVSNLGRVKSLERKVKRLNHFLTINERIRSLSKNKKNYCSTTLWKKNKQKTIEIHVLVAMSFLNHKRGSDKVVDHINNIKDDNRVENLQLITQRENLSKDKKNGTSKYTGVSWSKKMNKWKTTIQIKDKSIHLGYHEKEYDASLSYQKALKELL